MLVWLSSLSILCLHTHRGPKSGVPDEYVESGCLPFPFPFSGRGRRAGRTNDFRVITEDPNNINRHCEGGWNWNYIWGLPLFSMRLGEAPDCVTNCLPSAKLESEQAEPESISVNEGVQLLRRVLDNLGMPSDDEAELTRLVQCNDENSDQKLDEREFWRLLSDQRLLSTSARPAGSRRNTGTGVRAVV